MSDAELLEYSRYLDQRLKNAMRYCFLTRGIEFQRRKAGQLSALYLDIIAKKACEASAGHTEAANYLLAMECAVQCLRMELEMYVSLKTDDMDGAWENLIGAQDAARDSMSADESVREAMEERLCWLDRIESVMFPRQVFMSPGLVARKTHCSICKKPYEECQHLKGKAYNGEFCAEVIEEADLKEVSVVTDPANKRARVTAFGNRNAKRNTMTLRRVSDGQ